MSDIFNFQRLMEYFPQILKYTPVTLSIVGLSLLAGSAFAVLLAVARIYKIPFCDGAAKFFISFIRGTPINIQLYVIYFGVPGLLSPLFMRFGYNINRAAPFIFVVITYALNNSAFMAELIRAAVTGVDQGQVQASRSIGMTGAQTFRRIIAPQAFRITIPDFGNMLVNLLKNTSLAYSLGIVDIMGIVRIISNRTQRSLEGYVATAVIFLLMSTIIDQVFSFLQRRMAAQV